MYLLPRCYLKLESSRWGDLRGCYPTIPILLPFLVHKFNPFFIIIIIIINSGYVPVVHNPISSATPISVFCLLRSFSPPVLFTPFSLRQHPIILRYTYLPTWLPHRYPIPGSLLSLPLSAPASHPPFRLRWHNPCHIVTLQEFRC